MEQEEEEKFETQIVWDIFEKNNRGIFKIDVAFKEYENKIFKSDLIEILKKEGLIFDFIIVLTSTE